MTRTINPRYALWMGYIVTPLSTALDCALLQWNSSQFDLKGCFYFAGICALFTVPQGWMSAHLLDSWRLGEYARVRIWCLALGVVGLAGFLWLARPDSWISLLSILLMMPFPICWALLFLLAAFMAREPKKGS